MKSLHGRRTRSSDLHPGPCSSNTRGGSCVCASGTRSDVLAHRVPRHLRVRDCAGEAQTSPRYGSCNGAATDRRGRPGRDVTAADRRVDRRWRPDNLIATLLDEQDAPINACIAAVSAGADVEGLVGCGLARSLASAAPPIRRCGVRPRGTLRVAWSSRKSSGTRTPRSAWRVDPAIARRRDLAHLTDGVARPRQRPIRTPPRRLHHADVDANSRRRSARPSDTSIPIRRCRSARRHRRRDPRRPHTCCVRRPLRSIHRGRTPRQDGPCRSRRSTEHRFDPATRWRGTIHRSATNGTIRGHIRLRIHRLRHHRPAATPLIQRLVALALGVTAAVVLGGKQPVVASHGTADPSHL